MNVRGTEALRSEPHRHYGLCQDSSWGCGHLSTELGFLWYFVMFIS